MLQVRVCHGFSRAVLYAGTRFGVTADQPEHGAVVVQDAETYEKMAALAEYAESVQSIRQAMSEQGRSLDEFTAEFEARHGKSGF